MGLQRKEGKGWKNLLIYDWNLSWLLTMAFSVRSTDKISLLLNWDDLVCIGWTNGLFGSVGMGTWTDTWRKYFAYLNRTEPKDCINADIVMSCQIFHSSCNIMAENSRADVLTWKPKYQGQGLKNAVVQFEGNPAYPFSTCIQRRANFCLDHNNCGKFHEPNDT